MIKPLNYSQDTTVQQGPLKTPVAFLPRLNDARQKHTNIVSAPDIHKNLQNLVAEGSRDLDQLFCVATSIYKNRDLEKEKKDLERKKRKDKWRKL
jgi:hypothetical protein